MNTTIMSNRPRNKYEKWVPGDYKNKKNWALEAILEVVQHPQLFPFYCCPL